MFARSRKPMTLVVIAITLLSYGCPVQAITRPFELHEPTIARSQHHAQDQREKLHKEVAEQGKLDLPHIQIDEI